MSTADKIVGGFLLISRKEKMVWGERGAKEETTDHREEGESR